LEWDQYTAVLSRLAGGLPVLKRVATYACDVHPDMKGTLFVQ
jgi:hypothetical protein